MEVREVWVALLIWCGEGRDVERWSPITSRKGTKKPPFHARATKRGRIEISGPNIKPDRSPIGFAEFDEVFTRDNGSTTLLAPKPKSFNVTYIRSIFHAWQKSAPTNLSAEHADGHIFDPANIEDAREIIFRAIRQRRGQSDFRDSLLKFDGARCVVTGCSVIDVLEAAHIYPYRGPSTNDPSNGFLLRTDLHTLFDAGLMSIDPATMRVVISRRLFDSEYTKLDGCRLRSREDSHPSLSAAALQQHYIWFVGLETIRNKETRWE